MYQINTASNHFLILLLKRAIYILIPLFIVSFSFPYQILPDIGKYTTKLFEPMAAWTAHHIFNIHPGYHPQIVSDSTEMYADLFNIFLIAVISSVTWTLLDRKKQDRFSYSFTVFARYFLALHLLIYGANKIFKVQFYLPEPNTLHTAFGQLPKDILYWSTMGVSRSYSIFLGAAEIIAAVFLLLRKTSVAGALISMMIVTNVVAVNFAFDISVKLFSLLLLFLSAWVLFYNYPVLRNFVLQETKPIPLHPLRQFCTTHRVAVRLAKTLVVILLLVECSWSYIKTGNFNDDDQVRPILHGAYIVDQFLVNDSLPAEGVQPWKRIFIHRHGYFITELTDGTMLDYEMDIDTIHHTMNLYSGDSLRSPFVYQTINDSSFTLHGILHGNDIRASLKKVDANRLPALKKGFHWTIDQ